MPTPTRTASSSKRRPQEAIGSAFSASHQRGETRLRVSRALSCGVSTDDSRRALALRHRRCHPSYAALWQVSPLAVQPQSNHLPQVEHGGDRRVREKPVVSPRWRTGERAWLPLTIERQTVRASPRYVSPCPPTCIGRLA